MTCKKRSLRSNIFATTVMTAEGEGEGHSLRWCPKTSIFNIIRFDSCLLSLLWPGNWSRWIFIIHLEDWSNAKRIPHRRLKKGRSSSMLSHYCCSCTAHLSVGYWCSTLILFCSISLLPFSMFYLTVYNSAAIYQRNKRIDTSDFILISSWV